MSDADPVEVTLRPSLCLTAWTVLLHCSVLVPLWTIGIPIGFALAVTGLVLSHAFWLIRRDGPLANDGSIESVAIDGQHRCVISLRDGRVLRGNVAESTLVTGRLAILAIRTQKWRPLSRVVITADMTDPESFRRLRILLRWAYDRETAGPGSINGLSSTGR